MVRQASELDGFELGSFPPHKNALTATEVHIGRSQVVETLVIAPGVVVVDELTQPCLELTRQVVVLEQDLVLERAVIALDLTLGHGMIGVLRQNLNSNILMMEPAENGYRDDSANRLRASEVRRILVQGEVGADPIVV